MSFRIHIPTTQPASEVTRTSTLEETAQQINSLTQFLLSRARDFINSNLWEYSKSHVQIRNKSTIQGLTLQKVSLTVPFPPVYLHFLWNGLLVEKVCRHC